MRYRGLSVIAAGAAAMLAAAVLIRSRPAVAPRATVGPPTSVAPPVETPRNGAPEPIKPPPPGPAPRPELQQTAIRRHADGMARVLRQAIESGDVDQRANALKSLRRMGAEGVAAVRAEIERAARADVQVALRGSLTELRQAGE